MPKGPTFTKEPLRHNRKDKVFYCAFLDKKKRFSLLLQFKSNQEDEKKNRNPPKALLKDVESLYHWNPYPLGTLTWEQKENKQRNPGSIYTQKKYMYI